MLMNRRGVFRVMKMKMKIHEQMFKVYTQFLEICTESVVNIYICNMDFLLIIDVLILIFKLKL